MGVAGQLQRYQPPVADVGYRRLVSLELSRDSHRADVLVPAALAALREAESRVAA